MSSWRRKFAVQMALQMLYNSSFMRRIILTSILALALVGSTAWAEIERNPHSRSGSGVEEGQDRQVNLIDLPAADVDNTISLAARITLAHAVANSVKATAGRLLAAAPAPVETTAKAAEDPVTEPAPDPASDQPVVEPPANKDKPDPKARQDAAIADETEPKQQQVATLDDLADAQRGRMTGDQSDDVVIDTEPVVDGQALQTLTGGQQPAPAETAEADQPEEGAPPAAEGEEQNPPEDAVETLSHYDPDKDERRPNLTQRFKDYRGNDTVSVNPSVDDQLLLADEAAGSHGSAPELEQDSGTSPAPEAEANKGQEDEAGGTSSWVRAAPAGRARPVTAPSTWNRPERLPQLHPPEQAEPIEPAESPESELEQPTLPDPNLALADPVAPPVSALMDPSSLEHEFALAPVADSADARASAMAPVEPVIGDWPPRMPDYKISDRIRTVTRGNSRQKKIALTFDDGPHPEFTSQLLAVLGYYDVQATFFFVGVQAQKYPHWVKMVSQAGHEIGSHTYDHFRMPKMPREEKIYQIDEYQRLIEGLTGVTPRFMRPPGGQIDAETEKLLAERGMVLAMWDVALNDTHDDKTSEMILKTANRNIRSGSVVLVHDGIQATVDMLPALIEQLKAQGFEFVTMSELAAGL